MSHDPRPIACTLDTGAMSAQRAWIERVSAESLVSYRLRGRSLQLTYQPQAAAEISSIVALERECCAFLHFSLETESDEVVLTITAPRNAGNDARWLFAQFLPERVAIAESNAACRCCADSVVT